MEQIDELNVPEGENQAVQEVSAENRRQRTVLSYLHDLIFGLVAVLFVFVLLFRVIIVSGPSMKQTLQDGDCLILLSSIFYSEPKCGDIVVASKSSYKDGEPIIKRVVATEGQKVDIDFVNGIVYVDDVALDEPYVNTPTNLFEGVEFPLVVEKGCVFVMGDNRNDSKDSRSPEIGMVDRREILGKVLFLAIPGKDAITELRDLGRIGVLW